jgi:ubiquinone/menaquinone biosynthesis C-methylase UbiE
MNKMDAYLSEIQIKKLPLNVPYKKRTEVAPGKYYKKKISLDGVDTIVELFERYGHTYFSENALQEIIKKFNIKINVSFKENKKCVLVTAKVIYKKLNKNYSLTIPNSDIFRKGVSLKKTVENIAYSKIISDLFKLPYSKSPLVKSSFSNENKHKRILSMSMKEYGKFYEEYPDADELGYFKPHSPELIRMKNIHRDIHRNSKVLDIGCNSGGLTKDLIKTKNCEIYGIDINKQLVANANKKGIRAITGYAEKLPYEDNFFDAVVCAEILEHVIDPDKVMREAIRVLKPSGIFTGSVPTEIGDWGKHTIGLHDEHVRAFNKTALTRLFKENSLTKIFIKEEFYLKKKQPDCYHFKAIKRRGKYERSNTIYVKEG